MKKQKNLIARFIPYYKPHLALFSADMVSALVIAAINLIYPMITRQVINDYVPNKLLPAMLVAFAALLLLYLLKASLNFVLQYWGHLVGTRMQADMRAQLFAKLERLPFGYFDEHKTGSILSRLTNDLFEVAELAHHGPEDIFLSLITIIGSFILLLYINVPLTLIVFAFIPFIVAFFMFTRRRFKESSQKLRERTAEINADIESAISGVRVSRAYTAEEHEMQKFSVGNQNFVQASGKRYKVMGEFFSSMQFFMDFMYLVVLVAGGLFFYFGKIDSADFFTYILYISTLISPIRVLTTIYEQIQSGMTGFKRFTELLDADEEPEAEHAITVPALRGDIEFENVSFSYRNNGSADRYVIKNFSMRVPAGKTVALVGPSGGGKTTICHLIPRFYEIEQGAIRIDGYDIRELSRKSLRGNIAIVQQDVYLFNGTVEENIAYGDFSATPEQIREAAKKANIHEYIMSLPSGYQTNVGERGVKLSGGQKQRISIARAFLKDPPILILDEATSALDNATEMLIQESLSSLSHGRTVLVVAHRLSTIKNADNILVVTQDGVAEQGSHEQLMARGGLYKTLYEYQFKNL